MSTRVGGKSCGESTMVVGEGLRVSSKAMGRGSFARVVGMGKECVLGLWGRLLEFPL